MGTWSLAAGKVFLDWVAPPINARWLDIGCGTGVFTGLVLDTCAPATVVAVDPSQSQIDVARDKPIARRADFRVADAQALPFQNAAFDVVASSLVINFIPDPVRALAEMRRVGHPGGVVAGYVWDFAAGRGPSSHIRAGFSQMGITYEASVGTEHTRLQALTSFFTAAGLKDITTRVIDVTMSFSDFNEFWQSQTPRYTPFGKMIAAMSGLEREKLMGLVRDELPAGPDGSISCSARANAIKARVPE
jgi:ubiquinone/menaquinone biosynthesis C-methylase UbiE